MDTTNQHDLEAERNAQLQGAREESTVSAPSQNPSPGDLGETSAPATNLSSTPAPEVIVIDDDDDEATPASANLSAPPLTEEPENLDGATTPSSNPRKREASAEQGSDRPQKKVLTEHEKKCQAQAEADDLAWGEHAADIEQYWLRSDQTHKANAPRWQKIAAWNSNKAAKQARFAPKPQRRAAAGPQVPVHPQGDPLPDDRVDCPKIPSREISDYPRLPSGAYCGINTETPQCGTLQCTAHPYCRTGYIRLEDLEQAVENQMARRYRRIETLVMEGKLNRGHKTWEGWYEKALAEKAGTLKLSVSRATAPRKTPLVPATLPPVQTQSVPLPKA